MNNLHVLDSVIEKYGEYIEMVEADEQSSALIQLLCNEVVKERDEKETYKKMYESHRCAARGINS
jgi:vacuolar-type H+-ATPase subunit E/Vma4